MRRAEIQRSALIDGFLESYVSWREACEDVRAAYRRWTECNPQQRGLGFATYCAALDREEYAAGVHSHWADRIGALPRLPRGAYAEDATVGRRQGSRSTGRSSG
jgi:hypothetical protein